MEKIRLRVIIPFKSNLNIVKVGDVLSNNLFGGILSRWKVFQTNCYDTEGLRAEPELYGRLFQHPSKRNISHPNRWAE